jgi:hypothetical protein
MKSEVSLFFHKGPPAVQIQSRASPVHIFCYTSLRSSLSSSHLRLIFRVVPSLEVSMRFPCLTYVLPNPPWISITHARSVIEL